MYAKQMHAKVLPWLGHNPQKSMLVSNLGAFTHINDLLEYLQGFLGITTALNKQGRGLVRLTLQELQVLHFLAGAKRGSENSSFVSVCMYW
jgi:hypothetical protein